MSEVVVNGTALFLIFFIIWWFWLYRPKASRSVGAAEAIEILVADGVYTPGHIETARGESVVLRFKREDASPCAEKVIFSELGLSADLPLNQVTELTIQVDEAGDYNFSCQMGMYRGLLTVR